MKDALKQPSGGRDTIEAASTEPVQSVSITVDNEALQAWLAGPDAPVLSVMTPHGSYDFRFACGSASGRRRWLHAGTVCIVPKIKKYPCGYISARKQHCFPILIGGIVYL